MRGRHRGLFQPSGTLRPIAVSLQSLRATWAGGCGSMRATWAKRACLRFWMRSLVWGRFPIPIRQIGGKRGNVLLKCFRRGTECCLSSPTLRWWLRYHQWVKLYSRSSNVFYDHSFKRYTLFCITNCLFKIEINHYAHWRVRHWGNSNFTTCNELILMLAQHDVPNWDLAWIGFRHCTNRKNEMGASANI